MNVVAMAPQDSDRLGGSRRPICPAVSSSDAVTIRNPSGLKAAELTRRAWPRRALAIPLGRCVPDAGCLVHRRSNNADAIRTEGRAIHGTGMAAQDGDLLAGHGIPNAGGHVG